MSEEKQAGRLRSRQHDGERANENQRTKVNYEAITFFFVAEKPFPKGLENSFLQEKVFHQALAVLLLFDMGF